MDQVGWNLKNAYYAAGGIKYYGQYKFTKEMSAEDLSHQGFANGKGNCYVQAAMFYMMAKELNYDAHRVAGYCNRGAAHSWVEIDYNGYTYLCDPECYNETGQTIYMTSYKKARWYYYDYKRID